MKTVHRSGLRMPVLESRMAPFLAPLCVETILRGEEHGLPWLDTLLLEHPKALGSKTVHFHGNILLNSGRSRRRIETGK